MVYAIAERVETIFIYEAEKRSFKRTAVVFDNHPEQHNVSKYLKKLDLFAVNRPFNMKYLINFAELLQNKLDYRVNQFEKR